MTLATWLQLTDRYPEKVAIKGGHVHWSVKRIIFCCNQHIADWNWWRPNPKYPEEDRELQKFSVRERFSKIIAWTHNDETGQNELAEVDIKLYWPLREDDKAYCPPTYLKPGQVRKVPKPVARQMISNNYLNTNRSLNALEVTDAIRNDDYEVVQIIEDTDNDELLNW